MRIPLKQEPVLLLRAPQRRLGFGANVHFAKKLADPPHHFDQHRIGLVRLLAEKFENSDRSLVSDHRHRKNRFQSGVSSGCSDW